MSEIIPIDTYPIPFDRDEIIAIQEEALESEAPHIQDEATIVTTADGFHEKYIKELIRTDEWSVFRNFWNGGAHIYFWNHQLGYGFKIDGDWETMVPFVKMMETFVDEFDASDFDPHHYPWQVP